MRTVRDAGLQPCVTVRQAIDDLRSVADDPALSHVRAKHSPEFLAKIRATPVGQNVGSYSEAFHRCDPDKPSPTVKANNGSVFVHYAEDRLMTPRELARLQGFSDSHQFRGNKRDVLIQIGNAVPVQAARAFANVIKLALLPREVRRPPVRKSMLRTRTLRDALDGLPEPVPAAPGNRANPAALPVPNHEYFTGAYSSRYMTRQRVRGWDQPSFTIQAGGRYAPQHPSVSPMVQVSKNEWRFAGPDRRLSVRECARIQAFPDSHRFVYTRVDDGYKLVGNAVPPPLATALAGSIARHLARREKNSIPLKFSQTSKMPGPSWGTPAVMCRLGGLLQRVPNSICANCYALRGNYCFSRAEALRREHSRQMREPDWVRRMSAKINSERIRWFRWFDSGDLLDVTMLENIVAIADCCPDTRFWLPTRELAIVGAYVSQYRAGTPPERIWPPNLTVRLSANLIDGPAPTGFAQRHSCAVSRVVTDPGYTCHAPRNGGKCGDCRKCWERSEFTVTYHFLRTGGRPMPPQEPAGLTRLPSLECATTKQLTPGNALQPRLTFRDAVNDLPEVAGQHGQVLPCAGEAQNDYQWRMRAGSTTVTEHCAARHSARMIELMRFIPEGRSAYDADVQAAIPKALRPGRGFPNSYARLRWDRPAPTITRNFGTPSSASCIHPSQPRALTIREAARCQSFGDSHVFAGSDSEKCLLIANAVPPLLATAFGHTLRRRLEQTAAAGSPASSRATRRQTNHPQSHEEN